MKNIRNKLIIILFITIAFPHPGSSQDSLSFELRYEINRVYPSLSITKEQLNEAHTLIDLNPYYKPSWVREYFSVEILTSYKEEIRKAVSKNDTLSQEQMAIMKTADVGTDISVKVKYIPENTLKHNDSKEYNFSFKVDPEIKAEYPGGQQALKNYLKDNAMDKIPEGSFRKYNLTAVKFTIDEKGKVIDAHVFETSKDEKIDELLLETVRNMPGWKPAEYSNGIKVNQEFVFTVGDMESCVVPLLNIRRLYD